MAAYRRLLAVALSEQASILVLGEFGTSRCCW
jgi:hypothetical protein